LGIYSVTEILNDIDKTFGNATATAGTNKITVTIAAVTGKRHYIGSIVLTGTTGTGGAEALTIKDGITTVWSEAFTVGTDLVRQFQAIPLVGTEGKAVTIEASATSLTAGKIFVVYYTR
jgi:hypothetical protein